MIPTPDNQSSEPILSQQSADGVDQSPIVVPIIAEQLLVDKQRIETGQVRITKTVRQDDQVVDLPLSRDVVEVERVAIGQPVTETPAVRQEGDTTIYPVLEEVIVVEKRLMLVEEIRVTKRRSVVHEPQTVTVRREEVSVERTSAEKTERPAS